MSFLLGALKGLGGSLLGSIAGKAGGFLMNAAKPIVSTIGNAISGLFGGGGGGNSGGSGDTDMRQPLRKIGRTAADYLVDKGINAGIGYANQFANSSYIQRKMPMMVPYIRSGAQALGDRLRSGYNDLMGNRKGGQTGGQMYYNRDGVEKYN